MFSAMRHPQSSAFLLSQVGAHAARLFAERLAALRVEPPHARSLRILRTREVASQQELAATLTILPNRLVDLLDTLQSKALIERRDHPDDRRSYALHLTAKGKRTLEAIGRVAREHDDVVCAALDAGERATLHALLVRLADAHRLGPGVHPGFRSIGKRRR